MLPVRTIVRLSSSTGHGPTSTSNPPPPFLIPLLIRLRQPQHASNCFDDLLDSIITDVASECHRIARLGLDRSLEAEEEELRLSQLLDSTRGGAGGEGSNKHGVDIFEQSHPAVASDIFECMNCGRPIVAGRFAPHLEKCMGKGRNARAKATRSSTVSRSRHSRGSPISVYAPFSTSAQRAPNGTSGGISEDPSDYNIEEQ